MKRSWAKLSGRVDALSLRERAILFVVCIVGILALADLLWLAPAQNAQRAAMASLETQNAELASLRAELQRTAQTAMPKNGVPAELAEADARLAQINLRIAAVAPLADKGPHLEDILLQFLRRQEGMTLLGTGTLKQDAAGAASGPTVGLTKRGMELRVSGSYGDLTRYVRTLENALPNLRWGQLQLKSDKQPPELTLQVYAVGVQP